MKFKIALLFLGLSNVCLFADTAFSGKNMLKVGLSENPPLAFAGDDAKAKGIYADIIEHIAAREGWTLQYVPCKWYDCQQKLGTGETDILMSIAYTAERARKFDFTSEPVFNNWACIYRRPGADIESVLDLEDRKVATVRGNIHTRGFLRLLKSFNMRCDIIEAGDYSDIFRMIDAGKADAGVISRLNAFMIRKKYKMEKTSVIFNPVELLFATPKGKNAPIRAAIDRHLTELKKDKNSVYYQSLNKWLGIADTKRKFPVWLKWAMAASVFFSLVLLAMNLILRIKVTQKTGELKKSHDRLEEMVNERTDALCRRTKELERSNRDLEQFAYVVSHDLTEPLRMVSSYVRLLERRYKGQLDADADDFIGFAVDGAARMHTMLSDILALSRVGTSGKPFGPVEAEHVLEQTLADLRMRIRETKAVVTHDALPRVIADRSQLGRVFQNLISNAMKFRGQEPLRIHLTAEKKEREWVFSFQDNGIGIAPEHADQIFVIFHRLHTRDKYPGTGMGLAICKKIVERHGGRIWAESREGAGALFHFTLPIKEEKCYDDKNI